MMTNSKFLQELSFFYIIMVNVGDLVISNKEIAFKWKIKKQEFHKKIFVIKLKNVNKDQKTFNTLASSYQILN